MAAENDTLLHPVTRPLLPRHSLERRRLQCYLAMILADLATVFVSFVGAGYFYLGPYGLEQSSLLSQLLMPVFLTIALYNGAYSMGALESAGKGAQRAILALLLSAGAVVFIAFYTKSSSDFSRLLFTVGVVCSAFGLAWTRAQMRSFVRWRCGTRIINEILIRDGGPQIRLAGASYIDAAQMGLSPDLDDPDVLNRIAHAVHTADRVVVCCSADKRSAWATVLRGANVSGDILDEAVAELGAHGARLAGGHGWLRVSVGPLGLRARAIKRLFDVAVSGLGLTLLSPLLLLVAVAILIEDGSPVLFIQRRVGRSNRFFDIAKFRSMANRLGDSTGERSASRTDERVTRVGRLIRRTSIDELPQLFNVLIGQMSIVGPRPHALGSQAGAKKFWEVDGRYWQRHALKPGLTGLAQVRGLRGATDTESDLQHRLNADLEYVDGWSLWRDIAIIFRTVTVLSHDQAY
ncbi:sugar transferase [Novosphingobium sp.]|uniref:sugar transferase n=1 Tax=Novosphingobium sp. TaxID=1874826 RepID=UPI0025FF8811|nr:sugar transferase [Novosphingobium sp.]